MKIHARLSPGLVGIDEDITIRIHLPRKLAGVTLKLWETDAFTDRKGEATRDPAGDILLAHWDGDLEPGEGKTPNDLDYVKFTKTHETIACTGKDAEDLLRIRVRLPGSKDAVEIAVASEKAELVARGVSLAVSIEQGGSTLFRTKSTCIAQMPMTTVTFHHHRFSKRNEDGDLHSDADHDKHEEVHAHQWVTFGIKNGEAMQARLEVVGDGYLDARGMALESEAPDAQPLLVRKGRTLYAYVHERKLELPKGVSKIPLAVCEAVTAEGVVTVEVPEQGDLLEVRLAELPVQFGERATFATDLTNPGIEIEANEEHVNAWAEAAKRFRRTS